MDGPEIVRRLWITTSISTRLIVRSGALARAPPWPMSIPPPERDAGDRPGIRAHLRQAGCRLGAIRRHCAGENPVLMLALRSASEGDLEIDDENRVANFAAARRRRGTLHARRDAAAGARDGDRQRRELRGLGLARRVDLTGRDDGGGHDRAVRMRIAPAPAQARRRGSRRRQTFETLPLHPTTLGLRPGQDDPDLGPQVPRAALVVAQQRRHFQSGFFQPLHHLRDRERCETRS